LVISHSERCPAGRIQTAPGHPAALPASSRRVPSPPFRYKLNVWLCGASYRMWSFRFSQITTLHPLPRLILASRLTVLERPRKYSTELGISASLLINPF